MSLPTFLFWFISFILQYFLFSVMSSLFSNSYSYIFFHFYYIHIIWLSPAFFRAPCNSVVAESKFLIIWAFLIGINRYFLYSIIFAIDSDIYPLNMLPSITNSSEQRKQDNINQHSYIDHQINPHYSSGNPQTTDLYISNSASLVANRRYQTLQGYKD